jgi:hypothetical protein
MKDVATLLAGVTWSSFVAITAIAISCGSLIVAWKSYSVSQKSYDIAAQAAQLSKPNLTGYLIDAFRYRPDLGGKIVYIFCVSIENKSTIQNSIVSAEMRLPFLRDGVERIAIFPHTENIARLANLDLKSVIHLPVVLPIRGALIANFCFEVQKDMLERSEFDTHTLRLGFAEGAFVELDAKMIMDVVDVQHLENKREAGVPI